MITTIKLINTPITSVTFLNVCAYERFTVSANPSIPYGIVN